MIKKSSYRIKNHKTTLINNFIPFGNPRSDLLIFRMIFLFAANAIYILLKHDNELKILCRSDSNILCTHLLTEVLYVALRHIPTTLNR